MQNAKITEEGWFTTNMTKMQEKCPQVLDFFWKTREKWSTAEGLKQDPPVSCQGDVTSNTVEVSNKMLLGVQSMNIIDALKTLYGMTADKHQYGKIDAFNMKKRIRH